MTGTMQARAGVLAEALPYIRRFYGKVVVVKYGGAAMEPGRLASFAGDIVLMRSVGMRPIVVHGGGPQIGEMMRRLGKEPRFVEGQRVTDAETLDIARMVLVGKVNRDLVGAINSHAQIAVGLSGEDAGLIVASVAAGGLGFVGEVSAVNPYILERLVAEELVPVLATIGADRAGQAYNINADWVAAAVAQSVRAAKLIYLSDVAGVLAEPQDAATVINRLGTGGAERLLADGVIGGGMVPKVKAACKAVAGGVGRAHILDGRTEHALLLELFSDHGVGTMIEQDGGPGSRDASRGGLSDG
ncbi:MAG: acetylglutamate kinase [Acidimicrobiales bacterium]